MLRLQNILILGPSCLLDDLGDCGLCLVFWVHVYLESPFVLFFVEYDSPFFGGP